MMGITAFFSRPEALERTSNISLTQVSQQWVTEEPPARPGPRAFPFLQPSAWATGTQRLLRPRASHLVHGRSPAHSAPGPTHRARAHGPQPRFQPLGSSVSPLPEPRAPRPPAHRAPASNRLGFG